MSEVVWDDGEVILHDRDVERLLLREAGSRRRPAPAFVASRLAARAARAASGRRLSELSFRELYAELLPMAGGVTNFTVTLDTTAPGTPTLAINGGAAYAASTSATADFSTSDGDTTGYQIKIWGDVDVGANANIQATEGASSWITYTASQAITLSSGDGAKSISAKIRDDVWNETAQLDDSITLDTTLPVPSVTVGPDVTRVSKISGKRTVSFSFQSDTNAQAWKIKVVPATGSAESAGTTIGDTNGSTNMTGTTLAASTPVACTIDGRDLEAADSGDGEKIVKIFVQEETTGSWST